MTLLHNYVLIKQGSDLGFIPVASDTVVMDVLVRAASPSSRSGESTAQELHHRAWMEYCDCCAGGVHSLSFPAPSLCLATLDRIATN